MIFQLLWGLIGALCFLGYLFHWIKQSIGSTENTYTKEYQIEFTEEMFVPSIPLDPNLSTPGKDENKIQIDEITNLDDEDPTYGDITDLSNISRSSETLDLDEINSRDMSDLPRRRKSVHGRSFDAQMGGEESNLQSADEQLEVLFKKKLNKDTKYYATCTIKCGEKPNFLQTVEGEAIDIDDFDNLDYWIKNNEENSLNISIIPKCCLSTTPEGISTSPHQTRKKNPRESFREDILQISNKSQESTMKRKYALADMLECDREYCAHLKLIKDVLDSLDLPSNDFGNEIESLFSSVTDIISCLCELHENEILPRLSACTMNPTMVATEMMTQQAELYNYSKLQDQWTTLKNALRDSLKKYIFLINQTTSEKSKFSILSFNDLMKMVKKKIPQYITFFSCIMRYTGRIDGNIYGLQRAITMLSRIERSSQERIFLKKLLKNTEIDFSKSRIIRMTELVMVSETEVMKIQFENLKLINEEVCSIFLLKNHIICANNSTDLIVSNVLDLNFSKIYSKDNYEGPNEIILWSKIDKINYRIFKFHFPSRVGKLGWLYDIKKRLEKKGADQTFVSSLEFENQYTIYLEKHQKFAAIEMETISLESASLDNECSTIYEQLEDVVSIAETTSDIKFESAITDVPSSITSGSYKTAAEAFRSDTDRAKRPVSGISLDSVSTLDGVRTPFSDEESLKCVSIITDVEEIHIPEGGMLVWVLNIVNYDFVYHDILWTLSGKILDVQNSSVTVQITPKDFKIFECRITKESISKLDCGPLMCKVLDKVNGALITSKSVNIFISSSCIYLDLTPESSEITVVENDLITFKLNTSKGVLIDSTLKHLIWYKDNEKLNMNNDRIKCFIDRKTNQIILNIEKAYISDAGIYTVDIEGTSQITLKKSKDTSILLLVEKHKKKVFQTASQENQMLSDNHIESISPLINDLANHTKLNNDFVTHDTYESALTSTTLIPESKQQVLHVENRNISVSENEDLSFKVLIYAPLISPPKWFLNSSVLTPTKNVEIVYNRNENYAEIKLEKCNKSSEGVYKCSIINPYTKNEEFEEINVLIINKSIGSLSSEVEEIDLKCGETLAIKLECADIPISALKSGSWYLNSKKLDPTIIKGKETISEKEIKLVIPDVAKEIAGIIQFRIEKPVKIYSPDITIKIRGSTTKVSETKPAEKDSKAVQEISSGLLNCEIEEIDLNIGETLAIKLQCSDIPIKALKSGLWYLNSKKLDPRVVKGKESISEKEIQLMIPNVTKDIAGIIQFRIDRPVKIYSPDITIKIRGSPRKNSETKPAEKDSKPIQEISSGLLNCEIEEIDLNCGETLAIKLECSNIPISALKSGSWYLNSKKLDPTILKGKESISEKEIKLVIPDVTKEIVGIIQFRIEKPVKIYSPDITIKIRGSPTKVSETKPPEKDSKPIQEISSGLLNCEIEEIDLSCGETLAIKLECSNIPISALKSGSWYLNSKKLDPTILKGKESVSEKEIKLVVPDVTKEISGIIQFRIEKPVKIYSPDITIKIRSVSKSEKNKDTLKKEEPLILECHNINLDLKENEHLLLEAKIISGDITCYQEPQWLLNERNISNLHCKTFVNKSVAGLEIENCLVSDAGQYKVVFSPNNKSKLEKVYGTFSVSVKSIEKRLKEVDSNIETYIGESVTLCVDVEGFTEKDIQWKILQDKDQNERPVQNERIFQKFNNNLAFLLIDSVTLADSGTYICQGFANKEFLCETKIKLTVINDKKSAIKCNVSFEKEMYFMEVNKDIVLRALIDGGSTQFNIRWIYNGEPLQTRSGVSFDIKENGKIAELLIKDCKIENRGIYECVVENKNIRIASAQTELRNQDHLDNILKCKNSLYELYEGEQINFEVFVNKKYVFDLKWSKENIDITEKSAFVVVEKENRVVLVKNDASLIDSGKYKCEAYIDGIPMETIEFSLIVRSKKEIGGKLSLIIKKTEILLSNFEPLKITIEVVNGRTPAVEWLHNKKRFGEPYVLYNKFIELHVEKPTSKEHGGKYLCRVINEGGETETVEINVKFQSDLETKIESGDLLEIDVEEVDIEENEKLELSVLSKTPTDALNCLWFKNDKPVNEADPRLTIIVQPLCYNLILRNIKLDDAGTYSLRVKENVVDILVKVRQKKGTAQTKEIFENLKVPKIKKSLQDNVIHKEPEIVKFDVEVEDCGPTKAIWFFEEDEIELDNAEFIQWSCDNFFALTIPMAGEKHCGRYMIHVANDMGVVKSEARLSLLLKREIQQDLSEACCIAPMFTKKLKDVDVFAKETIKLNCRMMCDPKPKILWTKDGETLDPQNVSKKIKILDEFPNFNLIIMNADNNDAGTYCCLATNFLGYDTTEATVTIIDQDENETKFENDSSRIMVKPLNAPILTADISIGPDVTLSWTSVQTTAGISVTYHIEKQKSITSLNWKRIMKNITNTSCVLSSLYLPHNENHTLRCVATSEYGFETVSNIVNIPIRVNNPILPIDKPTILFKDATCAKIAWLRGRCKDLSIEESIGKVFYTLEMKDNPKSSWQIVSNELSNNEYSMPLEPGVSYMFRVTAFNDYGISEPSQSLIVRIDRLKLVPDFSIEPPWLHLKGQPCLKWRSASVPEFCESCVSGIAPDYKVEYRNGRLSPWKIYQENITQNEVYLTPNVIEAAQEFRVSCRNKFGQNGPTRSYRLQSNIVGKSSKRSPSVEKNKNVIRFEQLKHFELESISNDGISLKWEPWLSSQINRYIIQKKNIYTSEWDQIQSIIFGEDCFLELPLADNFSRQLRILALEENKSDLNDGYNHVNIPSKEECIPTIPENLKVIGTLNSHEIYWSQSHCNKIIESSISYNLQCKTNHQFWLTIADKLDNSVFINTKIDKFGVTGYRVAAKNSVGSSSFSKEVFIQSLVNIMSNEQIVKSIRYFVINSDEVEIKWHLCDSIFDNGLTTDDLSFQIEKKLTKETSEWIPISNSVCQNSLSVPITFEEENLFRIQPFYKEEKMTPSRIFRMYISKDLLVPDMSFTRPNIVSDSVTDYIIEWAEPELHSGFSPEGIEICLPSVLLVDLKYEVQFLKLDPKTRSKDIKNLQWTVLQDNIEDALFHWENPDPTQEYMFRVIGTNQFGRGLPSQNIRLHRQITLPDFTFVRLSIDENQNEDSKHDEETILSWTPPRTSPDLYIPYSVEVQYRPLNYVYSDDDSWTVLKANIKKNRVSINELDSNITYQIRIVPMTDFGQGKPSMIAKRLRRLENYNSSITDINSNFLTENVTPEVFGCLSQNVELKFTKLLAHNINQVTWTLNKTPIIMNSEKYRIFSTDSFGIYFVVNNLEEDDFGQYSAMNENQNIIQSFIIRKSDAPTILNCVPNRSLSLHENFYVSLKIDGQPPPDVVWRRNFKKMFSSYRTVISEDKETSTYSLMISKCILSDSGEYSIRAENAVGFAEVKFNLRVDAHPERKSIQINERDFNDRYYSMKQLSKGTYSTCQILIEKSTENEFIGKHFDINNFGVGKSEFGCIQSINHRNIVELFDAIAIPNQYLVLVYEKLQGPNLVDYISRLSHWCESQVRTIIQQLLQAVAYLHTNNVCHLDIKPENIIMVGKYNEIVKLCGFSNSVKQEDFKSRRHMFVTSPFSAPELLKGEFINLNCDVWSIGILTFLCLYGHAKINFEGDYLHVQDSIDHITTSSQDFIKRCLSIQTDKRYSSMDAVNHEWFSNKSIVLNSSLDYLIETIAKLMMYPEEMVPNFPLEMKSAIENFLISSRPKVIFDNFPPSTGDSRSPSISQLSSRASSASRDGINYERCDQSSDNSINELKTTQGETFQAVDKQFVSNTTKELLFTVPLKDQSFKGASVGSKTIVTLTCQLSLLGSEPISISWYRNQELLTDDSRIKLEVIKGGFLSCTILNASDTDVGIYRCVARCHSLRTETCARLVMGDVPLQPEHVSVYYVNENDVLLKWDPYLFAIDDIIYRIDTKIIDESEMKNPWQTVGFSVDNRYLLQNLDRDTKFIARIIAQNKYGCSSYSIATCVFRSATRNIGSFKQSVDLDLKWMLATRQSQHFSNLHDLVKDISSDDIRMNVIEQYSSVREKEGGLSVMKIKNPDANYPEYIIQRKYKNDESFPAVDLCIHMKYFHLPITYGEICDPSSDLRITFEEYVPGGNLLRVLLARSMYSEFTVVTIIRQLLETVQFLHSHNLVHANINPSNILVARRTNQLFDIKLIGLETCQVIGTVKDSTPSTPHKMSIFKAPEFRYDSITKNESDIWSLGILTFLLLSTQLPAIEDACSDADVHCCVKNTKTLLLPMTHSHFRAPKLSILHKFSKSARKFVHNSLKKNSNERGNADYWLANSWFKQDPQNIYEMQIQKIISAPLAEFVNSNS